MAIKMVVIPIKPNSLGVSIRASIIPTTNVIPCLEKLSIKLQRRPEMVLSLRVIGGGFFTAETLKRGVRRVFGLMG
jgi:hypothetical protein